MKIEKRLEGKGDISLIDKLKKMASVEDYKNLLDNFIDGIDVKEDESVTDYLKRNGFKGITDNEVKAKNIQIASDYGDPSYVIINDIMPEVLQMMDEFRKAKEEGTLSSDDKFGDYVGRQKLKSGGLIKLLSDYKVAQRRP